MLKEPPKNDLFNSKMASDATRSGCLVEVEKERLEALLQKDNHQTIRELAEQLPTPLLTSECHGKIQKLGAWVPHELS